jgi:hypothetical protein
MKAREAEEQEKRKIEEAKKSKSIFSMGSGKK